MIAAEQFNKLIEGARTDLLHYFALLNPEYVISKHQHVIIDKLMSLYRGDISKLAISISPGHSKSILGSVTFPSFILGNNPQDKVILVSYASDLAGDFGAKSKMIMESDLFKTVFPEMTLLNRGTSSSKWDTTTKGGISPGGLRAAGRGGSIMGFRSNYMIVDDLIKNRQEAQNKDLLNYLYDWYQSDMRSRMLPHSKELIIMTRWSEYDLIGRLTKEEDDWEIINFTAECIDPLNDPLGRKVGEFLWEEFYPKSWYLTRKRDRETWEALYQGNPKAFTGNIFKPSYWAYYNPHQLPEPDLVFQSLDTASKKGQRNDFSVCITWYAYGDHLYVVDLFRDKLEFPDLLTEVKKLIKGTDAVVIEDASSGIAISQSLARAYDNVPVFPMKRGTSDKIEKQNAVLPEYKDHKIHIPIDAVFTPLIEEEHDDFPVGATDDVVDAMRVGVKWFYENKEDIKKLREQRRLRIEGYNLDDIYNRANKLNYRRRKYGKGYKARLTPQFG